MGSNVYLVVLLGPKTVFSFSEHRNPVNIRRRFQSAVCRVMPWCLLHIVISVNVPPGHQRDRKMSENSISVYRKASATGS